MPLLNIRNLPPDVHRRLRIRAATAGRSMEAEARAILSAAVMSEEPSAPGPDLQGWVAELYGGAVPSGVVDDLVAERRREAARE
jgi:hypothetical protein